MTPSTKVMSGWNQFLRKDTLYGKIPDFTMRDLALGSLNRDMAHMEWSKSILSQSIELLGG
eukprot:CAMPEP_0197005162 /NCGR_PEP_ID=MMETSP1380-20130617/28167_1 /TAXON_ID=5936 /ORGANISM="Euplotes crassus, Strain CT5" /LENGTH=60 /DNA_ID=CAMNT_0042424203 /DNA_START=82 /DNA_END=264 /DNA_ORIENTATION=+